MTKRFLVLLAMAFGCDRVDGSGHPAAIIRALAPFDAVEVSAGLDVSVVIGEQEVRVEGDDNLVPHVRTEVAGDRLRIWPDHDLHPLLPLRIHVSAAALTEAALSAGGSLSVSGVGGDLLTLRLHSGGEVVADGAVEQLVIEQSAGGTLDASRIDAQSVHLTAAAGGETRVRASRSIDGRVASGSVARVLGMPNRRAVETESGGEVVYE